MGPASCSRRGGGEDHRAWTAIPGAAKSSADLLCSATGCDGTQGQRQDFLCLVFGHRRFAAGAEVPISWISDPPSVPREPP